jgi:cysteinyl-tRNA synthetase
VLKLYNTLTRKKEDFRPLDAGNVRMYVCGPTVYDFAHIGNARPVIVFDVLYRLLRHLYGPEHVTYVRNITDVDDKINARAAQDFPGLPLNEAIRLVTTKTTDQFHADMKALGALDPTVEPRATEHIEQMRAMIERLIERGSAYVAEDHVLFDVASMPDYGKLSGRSLDEMIAGARVEVAPYKCDPMDFVLWKPSKPGEPSWASPAGVATPGRPGWHIECSAMADRWLWEEAKPTLSRAALAEPHMFDIHGGGIDLVFPHHENELAQSRCANRTPIMAQVWMHNGFLQVEGEKMAKSAGNFVTVHELLEGWQGYAWPGEALRFNMLRTQYRQPLDWTLVGLDEAHRLDQGPPGRDALGNDEGAIGPFIEADGGLQQHFLGTAQKSRAPTLKRCCASAQRSWSRRAIRRRSLNGRFGKSVAPLRNPSAPLTRVGSPLSLRINSIPITAPIASCRHTTILPPERGTLHSEQHR